MHATTGAWRPTPTQSTCLYYCHGNEASKCADLVDYGLESGIITKRNILKHYKPSTVLEPKHFEKFVLSVFDKFCSYRTEYSIFNVDIKKAIISFDEDGTICFKTKIDVSKQALNALFGLFGHDYSILILIILLLSVNML